MNCSKCGNPATHVLATKDHEIIEPAQCFCEDHAFDDDRGECACCWDSTIEVPGDDEDVDLIPTYPAGELDKGGMCAWHP